MEKEMKIGAPGGAVGWGTALQAGRSRVRFPMMSLEFFIYYGHGVDPDSNRNEYQEYFPVVNPYPANVENMVSS